MSEANKSLLDETDQLFSAIDNRDIEKLEQLIEEGVDVNRQDNCGKMAMHYAVIRGDSFRIFQLLTQANADINSRDKYGDTPMHYAVKLGCRDSVKTLVGLGAAISIPNNLGDTSLDFALIYERKGIAEYLKAKGAIS